MQPKHLSATLTFVLTVALLAGCAAPAAAPAATPVSPPTATPVPSEAASPDPFAVAQAWADAIYSGDVDAALEQFTDDGNYRLGYTAYEKQNMRWVFDWLAGLETKWEFLDCQPADGSIACSMTVLDGCMAASGSEGLPVEATFTFQDGKIKSVTGSGTGPEWDAYWNWVGLVGPWRDLFRREESAKAIEGTMEGGKIAIKLCRDYENAVKTQEPATAAAAQGLVEALNSGDTDAALAFFMEADNASFKVLGDEAEGAEEMLAMFDWLAGKETQFQITDCEWQGIGTQCAVSLADGCIAASGPPEGVNGKMTFYSQEDGTLRRAIVVMGTAERKAYNDWLEAEAAWASANRADELAQAEGYSTAAGAMSVKLCQEYAAAPKLDDATAAKIDAIVQTAMTDYPTPGFEMCIVKDDQVVYNKGFGLANVASDRPMTPQSVSIQASISKSLAAMAVMQLVEQGKIDLDQPVTAYLPDFTMDDPRYEEITVRMLLSHLSGLPDTPFPWNVPLDPAIDPLEQAVRSLSDQQLISAPGEAWNPSSWGYSALGDIIAKVSGEPFASYMQQHLLEPMGMVNSTFVADEVDPELRVTGYISAEDGSPAAIEVANDPRDLPASGLWSNCEDMIQWARFMLNKGELNGARVLQPESIDAMWTSEAGTFWMDALGPWYGPYVGEYGLGWYVGEKAGHRLAGDDGANDGVNTHIQFAPDDGLAVIAIDNWLKPDPDWYPAGFAAFDVMDLLLGLQPDE